MNNPIIQILCTHLLDENHDEDLDEHWTEYVAVTKIAINATINASIQKASFEVLYGENIPLPVEFLLSKEFFINLQAQKFTSKMKQLVGKVKSAKHDG